MKKNKRNSIDETEISDLSKKKKIKNDLYKQPTVEEINQLRETENLFHSNLFRLQIDELLANNKIKDKHKKSFESWFINFRNYLLSIQDSEEFELSETSILGKHNVQIPMLDLPNNVPGKFKYAKPSDIQIIGSYPLDTMVGPNFVIDIMLEMPGNLFYSSDRKNYIYLKKRAMYLAYLAEKIETDLISSKKFIGSFHKPLLKVIPNDKLSKRFTVHIHLTLPETKIELNKLSAGRNNVKPNWFFERDGKDSSEFTLTPTPAYNSLILFDLTTSKNNLQCSKILNEYPNIRDGIILLKIWMKQRELSNNYDMFNGYILTMFVLHLLHIKKINTFMSSYQIIRNMWLYLAENNLNTEGISLCENEKSKDRINEYQKYFDCVFLDYSGYYNITSNLSKDFYAWISNQAKMSIKCLDSSQTNGFQILFMRKVPFYTSFDHLLCLNDLKAFKSIIDKKLNSSEKLNYGLNNYYQGVKIIIDILNQGLGNRVSLLTFFPHKSLEWELSENKLNFEKLLIGLQLNPDFAFNIIEKGPEANLLEAEDFRKFWSSKSELRRFKDGRICEAVIWSKGKTISDKRNICKKVIKYLLDKRFQFTENLNYVYISDQAEKFLKLNKVKLTHFKYGTEEAALKIIKSFDSLKEELISLTDIPLTINGVQGYSAVFRYAEVFPSLATVHRADRKNVFINKYHLVLSDELKEVPFYLTPIKATLQLSTSGKWPDSLEAIQKTKSAFYTQIAECVRKQYKLKAHGNINHLDIYKDGFLFRFEIAIQKEITIMKQQIGEDGIIKYRNTKESIKLEKNLFHLPKLTGALYGLHCQQPSFGPACCLAKRWLSSQLIDTFYMPEIVVELLMASIYLNSDPYKSAQTPQVAFFRFLEFFDRQNWSTDPIIINFNDEMTREDIIEVENIFGTNRESMPPIFISTPYDKQNSIWTKDSPTYLILNRVSALAKISLKIVEENLLLKTIADFDALFKPSLGEYDCIIYLKQEMNARRLEAINIDENSPIVDIHPYKFHSKQKIPVVDFNPVSNYLNELRNIYKDIALFFHDTYGGNEIGVLLNPKALETVEFKVPLTQSRMLDSNEKLVLNVGAMIEDFLILGKGIIKNIDVQSKRLQQ